MTTATDELLRQLRGLREALLWKAEGLTEAELRAPLTPTGLSLAGLLKHLAACEWGYFQMCFGRPHPDLPHLREDTEPTADFLVGPDESALALLEGYREACSASEQTVTDLGLDAPARVPWWSTPETTLGVILAHMTIETARHAGHADILREQIDGRAGLHPSNTNLPTTDPAFWEGHLETVRTLAKQAEVGALGNDPAATGQPDAEAGRSAI